MGAEIFGHAFPDSGSGGIFDGGHGAEGAEVEILATVDGGDFGDDLVEAGFGDIDFVADPAGGHSLLEVELFATVEGIENGDARFAAPDGDAARFGEVGAFEVDGAWGEIGWRKFECKGLGGGREGGFSERFGDGVGVTFVGLLGGLEDFIGDGLGFGEGASEGKESGGGVFGGEGGGEPAEVFGEGEVFGAFAGGDGGEEFATAHAFEAGGVPAFAVSDLPTVEGFVGDTGVGGLADADGGDTEGLADEDGPRGAGATLAAAVEDGFVIDVGDGGVSAPDERGRIDDFFVGAEIGAPSIDHGAAPGEIGFGGTGADHELEFPRGEGIEAGEEFFFGVGGFEVLVADEGWGGNFLLS